jgi:pilus assembly protein CpaF
MRLETMVAMANMEIPNEFMKRFISSAIDVIIQVARLADGRRKLVSLQEITGMEGNVITLQEIFSFKQQRIDSDGNVKGIFRFHGVRPKFIERFKVSGIKMPMDLFDPSKVLEV